MNQEHKKNISIEGPFKLLGPNDPSLPFKYHILNLENGEPQGECIVLRPSMDPAAFRALQAYVHVTPDHELGDNIFYWLDNLKSQIGFIREITLEHPVEVYEGDYTEVQMKGLSTTHVHILKVLEDRGGFGGHHKYLCELIRLEPKEGIETEDTK